jgi:hypothetical protein
MPTSKTPAKYSENARTTLALIDRGFESPDVTDGALLSLSDRPALIGLPHLEQNFASAVAKVPH